MKRSILVGAGHYVPPKVVTNDDLAKLMTTSDEWIVQRSGIKERHYIEDGVGASDLALEASKMALSNAGLTAQDLDLIIFATLSPDIEFPGPGCLLQDKLGCRQIPALDIRNQCSGFVYGLQTADEGKGTKEDRGVQFTKVCADGSGAKDLWVIAPQSRRIPRITPAMLDEGLQYPQMNGKTVFKWATEKMPEVANEALQATGTTVDDLAWFVPHQANLRINEMVAKRLGIPGDKCWNNIVRYGNTTAATIPIGLSELLEAKKTKEGDLILMAAFGSGFTWGSALLRM